MKTAKTKGSLLFYFILALTAYSIFVVMDAIAKKLIGTYHVSQIIFINSWFALIPISLYTTYKKSWVKLKNVDYKVQIARASFNFLSMTIFFVSSHYLSLVSLYSIIFITPLILTIGANIFLKERVGWRRYTAILVGFIGVMISINPFGESYNKYALLAMLAPFLAASGWLIVKKYGRQESIFSFMVYGKLFLILATGLLLTVYFKSETKFDLFLNMISGIIRGLGILLTFIAASKLPSSLFAPTQYVQIFTGAIIGYFYFGDIPTINNYIGNLLIIGAGLYIVFRELKLSRPIVSRSIRPAIISINKDD
jgi:drug/metabolite transporter (DMT)-like permease